MCIRDSMITGLKANIHEIARTFCTAYPMAKVLYPGKAVSYTHLDVYKRQLDDQFKTSFVFEPRDTPRQGKRNKRK